jgi:anti-sigma regulatory factor (Ser/Thr protein kinase)
MTRSAAHPGHLSEITRSVPIWLGPYPTAPGTARASVRAQISEWGRADLADDAELIVSELVTNAAIASARDISPVAVRLVMVSGFLVIEVLDQAPGVPVLRPADYAAETGRGLHLVASLAAHWGWRPQGSGKLVWAMIASD